MKRMYRSSIVPLFEFCSLLGLAPAGVGQAVELFGVYEASFDSASYANPYTDVRFAIATLTAPDGTVLEAPLFWDGDTTWKLRFSPSQVGSWVFSIDSSDHILGTRPDGSFDVTESSLAGGVIANPDRPTTLQTQNGQPFYFAGDTAWSAYVEDLSEQFDETAFEAYVNARAAQGFNVVHSMVLSAIGLNNQGGPPFASFESESLNPAYFQELDRRVAYLNERGITAGMVIAWARDYGYSYASFKSDAARQRFARYVAARYSAYNTYFIVAGEWEEGLSATQVTELGETIAAADPQDRLIGVHAGAGLAWSKRLAQSIYSQLFSASRPVLAGSSSQFADMTWAGFADYQQRYDTLHQAVLSARELGKPVVNAEYGYFLRDMDDDGLVDKPNSAALRDMRHATWDIVMAGGNFITGFGTTYLGGRRDPGPFSIDAEKNDPWEQDVQHVVSFFSDRDWPSLEPADQLVTSDARRTADGLGASGVRRPPETTYWAMTDNRGEYIVYLRGLASGVDLRLIEPGENIYQIQRFDPRTGNSVEVGRLMGTNLLMLEAPDESDWVYSVKAVGDLGTVENF